MSRKHPKFVIVDGELIMGHVAYHKHLSDHPHRIIGGGWFRHYPESKSYVFHGESFDFGPVDPRYIKQCITKNTVFRYRNNSKELIQDHTFYFDNESEIIAL